MLLADQKLVIGRIDGRYTGPAVGGSMADGVSDPSNMALAGIFGAAINQYIKEELGYHTDRLYEPLSLDVNGRWSFPDDFGSGNGVLCRRRNLTAVIRPFHHPAQALHDQSLIVDQNNTVHDLSPV
jgi:hypothetical protein